MSSSLTSLTREITIYSGIPIFIAGIVGGCLNSIVFLSLRTFRENSCAFYLMILSVTNVGQLFAGLFSRLLFTGFSIDWTQTSLFFCKFRPFLIYVTALISSSCLCLATIDQYFATCTRLRWQQWCNIKLAHRLVIIASIISLLEQFPSLAFYHHTISPINQQIICSIASQEFTKFNNYFTVLILWFIVPLIFTVVFASLAYRNVQQLAYRTQPLIRRELDKQLTVMVLVHVLVNFLVLLPNIVLYLLLMNDSLKSDPGIFSRINFAYTISLLTYYAAFSVSDGLSNCRSLAYLVLV